MEFQVIRAVLDPNGVKIIESISLSQNPSIDQDGWNFTKNGKYIIKSGYQVERVYPDMKKNESDIWTKRYFPEGTCLESKMLTKDDTLLMENSIRMSITKEKFVDKGDTM